MQKLSIKMAILIPVLSILVVGVVIMVVVVGRVVSASTLDLTDRLVEARVNEYTNEFKAISNDAYATVRSLAPIVNELRLTSENPREDIVAALEHVLTSDDKTVAVWTCWEPNALDGKDSEFANADEYHDETGRFVPYVVRSGNGIVYEPLAGYADPAEGEFYQGAKNSGKPYITDPYEYNAGGTTINMYSIAIPILNDGAVIGAVGIDVSLEEVLTAMNAGSILEDGYLFVLSPSGLFASHRDSNLLLSDYKSVWLNTFSADLDPILANGGSFSVTGFSDVTNSDMRLLASGLTIGDTGRYWGVCGVVSQKTVESASVALIWIVIGIGFALIAVVGLATLLLINNKLRKLPGITEMARKVAKGDIRFESLDRDTSPTKNEITLLERSFAEIADSVKEQTEAMLKIAEGDYSITVPVRCEMDVMNQSINSMVDRTNTAMSEINASTEQVSTGASQIADGAQSLAQGSTEQAATVQQLSAAISDISDKTVANARKAGRAAELAGSIQHSAEKGSRQMEHMVSAVNEINQAGQDISKVIKVIDDIAFQTNILALNAAVEAARAGQHGKGFAVVSEEVRNLAAKSAEAAKDTGGLIANSIEKAELGARIATETAASLSEIVTGIEESNKISEEIAASSEEQALGIKQINDGIEQVAQVVQRNSATSEESAAASEELSGQSAMLKELVAQFKLKDGNGMRRDASETISETGLSLNRGYGDSEKY